MGAVLNSEGIQILSDDDSGSGGNFRIATLLWPGEYFVRVAPWVKFTGQFDAGGYNVHAEGRRASPENLSLSGPPHDGVIETGDDEDYYRITGDSANGSSDVHDGQPGHGGALLGTDGSELAFNDDGGRAVHQLPDRGDPAASRRVLPAGVLVLRDRGELHAACPGAHRSAKYCRRIRIIIQESPEASVPVALRLAWRPWLLA